MKEIKALLARLDKEEAAIVRQLDRVRSLKQAALAVDSDGQKERAISKPRRSAKIRKRAPAGELANAIKLAVAAKPGIGNRAIRDAVKANGYPWSLEPLHVTKTLAKLTAAKEVEASGSGPARVYSIPVKS